MNKPKQHDKLWKVMTCFMYDIAKGKTNDLICLVGKYTKTNMIVYLEYSWKRWSYASRYHYPLLSFCISILCNQSIGYKHTSILLHQHEILNKSYAVKLYKMEIPIFFTSHCCNQYCRSNWWLIKRKTMHACICIFKFLSTSILLASNECIYL